MKNFTILLFHLLFCYFTILLFFYDSILLFLLLVFDFAKFPKSPSYTNTKSFKKYWQRLLKLGSKYITKKNEVKTAGMVEDKQ